MAQLPHIKEITVENFKRFEKLTIENIGQFNLIVGDNNVGKSSVLEMLLLDKDWTQFSNYLLCVLYNYRKFSDLNTPFIYQYVNKPNDIQSFMVFSIKTVEDISTNFELGINLPTKGQFSWLSLLQRVKVVVPNHVPPNLSIPFLPFQLGYSHDLVNYFSNEIQQYDSRMERLITDIKAIIPNINYFEVNTSIAFNPIIIIRQTGVNIKMPLGTFGDGAIKLFRILIEMQIHSGSRLMIDEIDTGIHYSRMKTVWKTLIRAAKANNVQLFATTHNLECIKYYKEALEEEGVEMQNEARIIRLAEMPDKQVKAYTREFHEFAHAIENENELR